MKLAASLVLRNELSRYLEPCIAHLREFVDVIVCVDDCSDDGSSEFLAAEQDDQLLVWRRTLPVFFRHEGRARDWLLARVLEQEPTHVLPLDADEFVTDGPALRALIEEQPDLPAWHLPIREVWAANEQRYLARTDGGWNMGRTLCWRVPDVGRLSFPNRALACGRVPQQVARIAARPSNVSLLHLGWMDESERVKRHARYVQHDGGRFHARAHLDSILAPDSEVTLEAHPWPPALIPWLDPILKRKMETAGSTPAIPEHRPTEEADVERASYDRGKVLGEG